MLQGIISGAIWFFIFLAIQILWFHLVTVEHCAKLIVSILAWCLVAHLGTIMLLNYGIQLPGQIVLRMFYGSLTMGCLFILYMPFYYTIATSLSIQTLIYLESAPSRAWSVGELQRRFASKEIVSGRLKVMVANGYLTGNDGKYRVAYKGLLVAKVFGYLKHIWRLSPGG